MPSHRLAAILLLLCLFAGCNACKKKTGPTSVVQPRSGVIPATYSTGDARYPADIGYFNVKTGYGAKGDGTTNDTAAIKKAMDAAMRVNITNASGRYGTVYFPEGTYLIDDQLIWATYGNNNATVDFNVDTGRGCLTGIRITNQGSGYGTSSNSNLSNPGPAILFRGGGGYGPSIIGRRTSSGGIDQFYTGLGNIGDMGCLGKGYKTKPTATVLNWKAYFRFEGQNKDKTILKLTDNNPKFQNANCKVSIYGDPDLLEACPAVIWTSNEMAANGNGIGESGYVDDIWNLTLNTGSGNPAAVGIDWTGSNRSSIKNVNVKSGDGRGRAGISVARSKDAGTGPAYGKNISISGFDYGIYANAAAHEVGNTFEYIDLQHINKAGVVNGGMPNWFRMVSASNLSVPVFVNQGDGGSLLVVDANFDGGGNPPTSSCPCSTGGATEPAIKNTASHPVLFLRNIKTSGYPSVVTGVSGNEISEYHLPQMSTPDTDSLNLGPVPNTPEHWKYPDVDPDLWENVANHGSACKPNSGQDAANCIQEALNVARDMVYLPFGGYKVGKTLHIPDNVRVFYGSDSFISNISKGYCTISIDGTGTSNVEVRNINFNQSTQSNSFCFNSARPATIADTLGGVNITSSSSSSGTIYLENVAVPNATFNLRPDQHVWARQYDVESGTQLHVKTTGGIWWILGYKTEGAGQLMNASNATMEILGSFASSAGGPSSAAAYENNNTKFSAHAMTLKANGWTTIVKDNGQNQPPNTMWTGSGNGTGAYHGKVK